MISKTARWTSTLPILEGYRKSLSSMTLDHLYPLNHFQIFQDAQARVKLGGLRRKSPSFSTKEPELPL